MNNKLLSIIAVFIGLFLPLKMQAQTNISAPLFSFVGDSLHMYCDTQGADIYYAMSEFANEEEAESLRNNMYVGMNSTLYTEPFLVTSNVVIKAVAMVPGQQGESEYTTLVYDYTAWSQLLQAINYGNDVLVRAQDNTQVDDDLKDQLHWAIEEGQFSYQERGMMIDSYEAEHWTNQILDLASQIESIIGQPTGPEPYAVLSDNNTVLTFYYDENKATRNGMSVGPFGWINVGDNNVLNSGWYEQRESITNVVFDASFANCTTLTSTANWFYDLKNLTAITGINNLKTDNVTDMRTMFLNCSSLTSLDVSGFKTDNVTSMSGMFYGCSGLTSLDVSNFNTTNVTNMGNMFYNCSGLTSLNVSNFKTENVTSMLYMFAGCSGLSNLDVSNFNTDNVVNMASMFNSCSGLTSLDVSNFNTANVTSADLMFLNCSGLTSLDVSNFKTENMESMSALFGGCSNLTSLNIANFNTSIVTNMRELFHGCSSLTSLDVSHFNTANVTNMWGMFRGCSSLNILDVSNFKTNNVTDMQSMFDGCSSLKTIYAGDEWSTANVTTGGDMFTGCTNLVGGAGTHYDATHTNHSYAHIDGGTANPGYFTRSGDEPWVDPTGPEPYAALSDNNTVLTFYYDDQKAARNGMSVGPFEDTGKSINSGWYDVNEIITTVVFDDSFANCTTLTSTAYWFDQCENLTTIIGINNLKTDNVTDVNSMFLDCHNIKSIDLSSLNFSNVTNMFQMFEDCRVLENVNFNGVNTENVTNMGDLFLNCHNLKSIDLSSFNTSNVTKMSYMFYRCDSLTTVYVGEGWTTRSVTDSERMFERCTKIVGGQGTRFDENHIDAAYAHIDGGTANPGYFTDKNAAPMLLVTMATGENGVIEATIGQPDGTKTEVVIAAGTQSEFNVQEGSTINLTFRPNEGYEVGDVLLNGISVKDQMPTNTTYVIEKVTDKLVLSVVYAPLQPEPYAVLSGSGDYVLTFRYDKNRSAYRESMSVGPFISSNNQAWYDQRERITTVVFDESFAECTDITSTANWFYECSSLTTIEGIGNLKTDNVTDMSFMFSTCHALKNLDLNTFNTSKAENMAWMFESCTGLTSLDLSNFNTANVTNMNGMFYGCSALETIYVGEGWNASKVGSSPDMFKDCTKLVGGAGTVYSADHTDAAYAHIDGGAANPGYLTSKNAPAPPNAEPYAVLSENNTVLTFYYDANRTAFPESMSIDPDNWRNYDSSVTAVLFDDSFANYTSLTSTSFWFRNFTNLTDIIGISNLKTDNVTDMSGMFYNCSSLQNLDLSGFNTDKVTDIEQMFFGCRSLMSINMSNFNTANVTSRNWLFSECASLASIQAGSANIPAEEYANIANPNLLVYVNDASLAPEGVQNVVINGHADEIILTNATTGNNNWNCPQAFTAEKITYTRDFKQQTEVGISRGWESISLPFNVQSITHESKGQIVPFGAQGTGVKYFWLRGYSPEGLHNATAIEANKPYVISMPNNTVVYPDEYNLNGRITFSAENTTVPATPELEEMVVLRGDIAMMPNYQYIPQNEYIYAINVGQPRERYAEGSVFTRNLRDVRPFEAYTTHADVNGARPNNIRIAPQPKYDVTGIKTLESDATEGTWYSPDGRKMQTQPQRKGIYISNGKKVVVK